ncbi:MAG: isocitrate lyase/PEP mutase family protein [Proteobacteria bacterium]|nr:isocitrate lyase/PEP mutase family protein [Pseudomonadota bacterium]
MKPTQILRKLIHDKKTLLAPGVFDGLSAILAEKAGFKALYASGGAIARSAGYPDIGLLSMTEVSSILSHMVNVTNLPIIADADTGFGNALNTRRTIQEFERIGIAALHIEDQTFPKRCGHLEDKSLIPAEEMCHKIRVAKETLQDPDFVLIARTDAIAVEGFENAIKRAKAYLKAGADVIFVEAPETVEQIEKIAAEIPEPKLINMFYGGKTPLVPTERLQELGYRIVIIPSDLQRAAIKAIQNTLSAIHKDGNSAKIADQLTSFKERELIVGTEKYLKIDTIV